MPYADRLINFSVARAIEHIATVETQGDRKKAAAELVAAAADGAIVGRGFCETGSSWPTKPVHLTAGRIEIPRDQWSLLKVSDLDVGAGSFLIQQNRRDFRGAPETLTTRYRGVEFLRDEVEQLWPELSSQDRTEGRGKPGPRPSVTPAVERAMRGDIQSGKIKLAQLKAMKQAEMKARYGASAETCRKARILVLAGDGRHTTAPISAG